MMILLKIAFRNILRNMRRSVMTMSAIAMGAIAMLLFGAFNAQVIFSFQTSVVQKSGHLSLFRTGYFDFGAGNPGAYGISDAQDLVARIKADAVLGPMAAVVTPVVNLAGIAGNFAIDRSKTFFGTGVLPNDRDRMLRWDEYHVVSGFWRDEVAKGSGLSNDDPTQGVIGRGLARILGLCQRLDVPDCPLPPEEAKPQATPDASISALSDLIQSENDLKPADAAANRWPRLDLLAATAGGAPNVVSIYPHRAAYGGLKEVDDSLVSMHIALAQQLVYGRGEHKVTGIIVQLLRSEDLEPARDRLKQLIRESNRDLEVRDYTELVPMYKQALGMFLSIFTFIAIIMSVIVLFTVVNTMSMSVMERVNEIGTSRAMGVRRSGIRRQFVVEGWLLGMVGATSGVILAQIIGFAVNHAGLTWTPPGQATAIPLTLLLSGINGLIFGVWFSLIAIATLAALVPANRAARMPVVDALRHV